MDLRSFIEQLNDRGQLHRIGRQVDWKYELGETTRSDLTPLLFENIKDYPGHRIFTNGLISIAAIGLALAVEAGKSRKELVRQVRKRVANPIAPTRVHSGPIFQNILAGEAVDLLKWPVPHWNICDAGRYIGTWHVNISRDPEDGSHNLGVYRMQILGPRQATISMRYTPRLCEPHADLRAPTSNDKHLFEKSLGNTI